VRYLTSELERAVPPGWIVEFVEGARASWRLTRREIPEGEWPIQEYAILLSAGLDLIVFTHSNNDVGPLGLHHVLQNAFVVDASALREFGVSACLEHLFANYRPNEWGYT